MFTITQQEGALGLKPGLPVAPSRVIGENGFTVALTTGLQGRWRGPGVLTEGTPQSAVSTLTDSVFQVLIKKKRALGTPCAHTATSELLRLRESQQRRPGQADPRPRPGSAVSSCVTFGKPLTLSEPGFLQ